MRLRDRDGWAWDRLWEIWFRWNCEAAPRWWWCRCDMDPDFDDSDPPLRPRSERCPEYGSDLCNETVSCWRCDAEESSWSW